MYYFNQRKADHRRRNRRLAVSGIALVVLVAAGWILAKHFLRSDTTVKQAAAVVTAFNPATTTTPSTYKAGNFSLQLPAGWKQITSETKPYTIYRWQAGTGSDTQEIDIYQDTIPANFAVNRVMAVQSNGDHLSVLGSVSDNCADFTKGTPASSGLGAPAKWDGVNFLCDLSNYERDVVGTSSPQGINTVTLKGEQGDTHSFFFVYTDHSLSPDYSALNEALTTFQLQ